jgi:DNA-binding response OmpR family regulator
MGSRNVKTPGESRWEERRVVYVVDDDEPVLQLVSACLENAGYAARLFNEPMAAYSAFAWANPKPCLLIVDYSMPDMTGFELLRRCRLLSPNLKAICITGVLMMDEMEPHEIKPDLTLRKPFAFRELLGGVRGLLNDG